MGLGVMEDDRPAESSKLQWETLSGDQLCSCWWCCSPLHSCAGLTLTVHRLFYAMSLRFFFLLFHVLKVVLGTVILCSCLLMVISFDLWWWISDWATGNGGSWDLRRHASCALWLQQVLISLIIYLGVKMFFFWTGVAAVTFRCYQVLILLCSQIFSIGGNKLIHASR